MASRKRKSINCLPDSTRKRTRTLDGIEKEKKSRSRKRRIICLPFHVAWRKRKRTRKMDGIEKEKKSRSMASRKREFSLPGYHDAVKIGDTLDVFPLLFTGPKDFLVSYNIQGGGQDQDGRSRRRRVGADDMRGKTILVYMLPLTPGGLPPDVLSLIAAYEDTDYDFPLEVVLVPVFRGPADRDRYREFVSKIPWPAVPFRNEAACERVQSAFYRWLDPKPCWLLVDPAATVLLTSEYVSPGFFNYYGIGELVPLTHKLLPLILRKSRKSYGDERGTFTLVRAALHEMRWKEDIPAKKGRINLKQLLGSPSPDFLLTKDGTKVPFSFLENKVVGLYFRTHASSRLPCTELIKKTYEEAIRLDYDFEIVQIDFHASPYIHEDPPYCCENIPWLTLPYMHSCCKRLVRLFNREEELDRDRLIIINARESNTHDDSFFEPNGEDIIRHFGIEAYPFTIRRLADLENRRRKEEIKLQLIFGPHLPLLRRRGELYDQVPVSQLWGKWVLLIFATHSDYKSSKLMATLESKYLEQQMNDELEVVYISRDTDASTFDDCTAGMPWLVHPYSWEFAHTWYQIFTLGKYGDCDDNDIWGEEDWEAEGIAVWDGEEDDFDKCSYVAFNVNGKFRSEMDIDFKDFPLSYRDDMRHHDVSRMEVLLEKYGFYDDEDVYWLRSF